MKNKCRHTFHDMRLVETAIGNFQVLDYKKYKNSKLCEANDPISKHIDKKKVLDPLGTTVFRDLLSKCKLKNKLVIDIGAGLGWYTMLAARLDFDVVAFENNKVYREALYSNVETSLLYEYIHVVDQLLDEEMQPATIGKPYREIYLARIANYKENAVNMLSNLIKEKKIRYIMLKPDNETRAFIESCGYSYNNQLFTREA